MFVTVLALTVNWITSRAMEFTRRKEMQGHLFFTVKHAPAFVAVVQSPSPAWLFMTPWTAARQASISLIISQSLLRFMCIESVMPPNHLILCCPLLLLPSILPSISVCSNESVLCIMWPKYWSFSFSISPSKEYSGLISFRIDWFDLLAIRELLLLCLRRW